MYRKTYITWLFCLHHCSHSQLTSSLYTHFLLPIVQLHWSFYSDPNMTGRSKGLCIGCFLCLEFFPQIPEVSLLPLTSATHPSILAQMPFHQWRCHPFSQQPYPFPCFTVFHNPFHYLTYYISFFKLVIHVWLVKCKFHRFSFSFYESFMHCYVPSS